MAVEAKRATVVVAVGLDPEDSPALPVDDGRVDELIDPLARLEGRVELNNRIRPEQTGLELALDRLPDPLVPDGNERSRVIGVVADQALAKLEDVHPSLCLPSAPRGPV
ncbi:MAG: hypothetical protein ACRDKU_02525 [Gaiellaceae bacterium]